LVIESQLKKQKGYLIYFIGCYVFGAFGWLLFALSFDVKEEESASKKKKISEV
jgi:hypothetical protein